MIVKNEGRVIARLLESVANVIDCYCICDTGSTDDTITIIESFFTERGIPGKIPREPFRDFGYNRSHALKQCESMNADYVLLLDADMIFQLGKDVSPEEFKNGLTDDVYHMYQGTDSFYYKNARIVRNHANMSYWGVTHEYVKSPEGSTYGLIEKTRAFINDIGDGGCKSDKFERDIRLLTKGLEDNPNNDRYTFYLANSYKDHGDTDLAIETYKKRIELGGWFEEVWQSYYNIGKCYRTKGDMVSAIHWWMEGYQFFPKRVENLYEIITHYRQTGKNQLAYLFYIMALKQVLLNPNPDYLFLQRDIYDYKLDYEFSIFGYYCNVDNFDITRICMKVLECPHAEQNIKRNVLSNYKFYAKKLIDVRDFFPDMGITMLRDVGKSLIDMDGEFVPSTPSLTMMGPGELAVNVRFVNYRINERGGYDNKDHITTKNVVAVINTDTWTKTREDAFLVYNSTLDNLYVGLEDVRLFYCKNQLLYNCNRGLGAHHLAVEHGRVKMDDTPPVSGIIRMAGQREVEKNWVLFEDAEGNMKCVYNWNNLVIGDIVDKSDPLDSDDECEYQPDYEFVKTHEISTPLLFKHFRGSTNGLRIGGEIWFICHVVSYEDRRYYYHVFITLDAETYEVKRYTPLFTFEGEKVEYTLGFVYRREGNQFLIGYSKMDSSTHYIAVKKSVIEGMM
jgi:glycosyltransferase involved in cell wall biosynthesis